MPQVNYKPTTREVASRIRVRLVDTYGKGKEDFDDSTTPTKTEVMEEIDNALVEVGAAVGETVPDDMIGRARKAVTYLAAAGVESGFFAEQSGSNNSVYNHLIERYKSLLGQLEGDLEAEVTTSVEGGVGGFPHPTRWETRRW